MGGDAASPQRRSFPPVMPAPTGTQSDAVRSRSVVRAAILLLLRDHESHGYELVGRLAELGVDVTPTRGGLYRSLRTMADEGLVTSYWSNAERGPARRVYAITEKGEQDLEASMKMLASLARTVRVILKRYRSGC